MISKNTHATGSTSRPGIRAMPSSDGFVALLRAFFGSGGIARAIELESLLQERQRGDYISLARLIATGRLFFFEWRDALWVPMCQFDPRNLQIKPGFEKIWHELAPTLGGWQTANWLALPNVNLDHRRPIDVMDIDPPAVLLAARLERGLMH